MLGGIVDYCLTLFERACIRTVTVDVVFGIVNVKNDGRRLPETGFIEKNMVKL